jgi:hypothetical protein
MSASTAFWLTKDEIANLFEKLPAALQQEWKKHVVIESLSSFETEAQLRKNFEQSRFEMPGLKEFIDSVIAGSPKPFPEMTEKSLSQESLAEYFATIGASGISALLHMALSETDVTSEQLDQLAGMSRVRHVILEANSTHTQ